MLEISYSFYGILFAIVVNSAYSKPCKFIQPCTCSTDNYSLDLKPLMKARNDLEFNASDKDYTYYLHPCNVPPPICKNQQMTACQISKSNNVTYGIATHNGNQIDGDPETGNFSITNKYDTRTSIVYVVCGSEEATFLDIEPNPFITYKFTLTTRYGCIPQNSSGNGLSVGSVLAILFFVFFLIYLVGGVLFLKFVRKAEGIEMIPNIEFWKDLPSLIKDGMVFTFRGCKAESTYEKI
ncbi:Cation-dependent mannose-6-phosphate receptor [Biomphalaria pfeifferi]|uniref:Cation-dependent mannose-6-phosphate receptor n=1 Tax=Biomphalaria pfeifferi TaxID=112525 RepID=A0AAD8EY08_BIOPF|nr:Cation-dependent mannose-6-phosphate receptor [Biomphalaria pfeifferi]